MIRFLNKVNEVIFNPIIGLLIAIGVVYFIISIIKLIWASKEGGDLKNEKNSILYSLIGIFIMVSVYGIINFILNTIDEPAPPYLQNKLK